MFLLYHPQSYVLTDHLPTSIQSLVYLTILLTLPNSIFPYFPYLNLTPSNPSIKFGKGHQEPSLLILHTNLCLQSSLNYEQNYLGTLALLPHHLQIHHFFFALHISCNMSSLKMGPMSPRPMRTLSCEF